MTLKADDIRRRAAGRWPDILRTVCGLSDSQLNPRVHGPCPQCGGTDRFRPLDDYAETGGLFCNQCFSTRNGDGFAAIQWLNNVTFNGALKLVADAIGETNGHHKPASKPAAKPAATLQRNPFNAISSDLLKSLEAESWDRTEELAEKLRLSVDSLKALGVGYSSDETAWTFPERTADGIVCGINRRFQDGEKKMMKDHKRGLYFSDNWRECSGPVLIVEGGSDTAAGITLGLATIGRPSAIVPKAVLPELVELLKTLPTDREIVVIGERDEKADGDWPGKKGAVRTAKELTEALSRPIRWALPSGDNKDLRSWLNSHPAKSGNEFLQLMEYQVDKPAEDDTPRIDFQIIDSRMFSESDFQTTYLIDGIMTDGQPQLYGGPSKSLKTSVLVDQCLSLAAGVPFLGQFDVQTAKRVLLLSSESGTATLQETASRICKVKQMQLAELGDQLLWGFRPPQLTDAAAHRDVDGIRPEKPNRRCCNRSCVFVNELARERSGESVCRRGRPDESHDTASRHRMHASSGEPLPNAHSLRNYAGVATRCGGWLRSVGETMVVA